MNEVKPPASLTILLKGHLSNEIDGGQDVLVRLDM